MQCINCKKETDNPKFCSRSCSAQVNNKRFPKRKLESQCHECQTPIGSGLKFCEQCRKPKDYTIKEAMQNRPDKKAVFSLIRLRSRTIGIKLGWKSCIKCGYDRHVEICHIKPISEFSEDTLISVINDVSNLICLCPNHHWELDHPETI